MQHKLLEILACPSCRGRLRLDADSSRLLCSVEKIAFPIRDDIPVLLCSEATNYEDKVDGV